MAIDITTLSNGTITQNADSEYVWTGTGIFDELMKAVDSNLKVQYDNGRIRDADYAQVYAGSIGLVIQESMKFLLLKEQTEAQTAKVNSDKLLTDAQKSELLLNGISQREKLSADKLLVDTQKSELTLNGTSDRSLKTAQQAKVAYETSTLLPAQVTMLAKQSDLYTRQKEGFDDNANQKVLDSTLNAWAMAYSSGMLDATNVPSAINDTNITTLVNRVINGTDIGS